MRGHLTKLWRESATLIMLARNGGLRSPFDYRVLLLERNSKSRFMPNREVFPGGVIDKCDFADEWMELYEKSFQKLEDFSRILDIKKPRPPIFRKSNTSIPTEIAFRICAIRETFEESGILLLRSMSKDESENSLSWGAASVFEDLPTEEVQRWRTAVHNDGSQFIHLCRELQSVPDVWALTEWSDWLTPASVKIRFDTVFFMCFVNYEPVAQHDNKEMIESKWKTPVEAVVDTIKKKALFGPPQLYNALQFCGFTSWETFKEFQQSRAHEGCDQMLTIILKCKDGIVAVKPGDDLYPSSFEHILQQTNGTLGIPNGVVKPQEMSDTLEALRNKSQRLHRHELSDDGSPPRLFVNVKLDRRQSPPVTDMAKLLMLAQAEQAKL